MVIKHGLAAKMQHGREPKRQRVGFINCHALKVMSKEVADMQRADETLVAVRKAAEKTTSVGSGFFILT